MRRVVSRVAAEREPHLIWNAFVDLVAVEAYEDLTEIQRRAHLVFWYDSEVQNGGHDQYFENCGTQRNGEVIEALERLGLPCLAKVFAMAASANSSGQGLSAADDAYHLCAPSAIEGLEAHLTINQDHYVELS